MIKEEMNILYCIDELKKDYSKILGVSIYSLLENNRDENIVIYVMSTKLEESNKNELVRIVNLFGKKIVFSDSKKEIIPKKIKNILQEGIDGLPLTTYYRLFFNNCFPELKDRLLYIDCDTIVNKNLHDIYYSDFKDNVYIGTKEKVLCYGRVFLLKQGLMIENYVNAGVLLVNIPKFLEYDMYEEISKVNNKYNISYKDQDYINVIFKDKIKINNNLQTRFLGTPNVKVGDYYVLHTIEKLSKPLTQTPKSVVNLYNYYLGKTKWKDSGEGVNKVKFGDIINYIYVYIINRIFWMLEKVLGEKFATYVFLGYSYIGVFFRSIFGK